MIILGVCLGVLGAYIGTSILLTRFPLLLHKKKKQAFVCKHISHRGGTIQCNIIKYMAYVKLA